MSLVGPRPSQPSEVLLYEPQHFTRLLVKPGITGMWQVSGRSELAFDDAVTLDAAYVRDWSPLLDFRDPAQDRGRRAALPRCLLRQPASAAPR